MYHIELTHPVQTRWKGWQTMQNSIVQPAPGSGLHRYRYRFFDQVGHETMYNASKAELLQLKRTQFPSLGFFIIKKVEI